jgi:(2Fe-2S) ferredoxin
VSQVKTIEDLKRLKERAIEGLKQRDILNKPSIVIGMGTCGIAAGAREVMKAILDELEMRRQTDVLVSQTGCIGLCVKEPLVDVTLPGQAKVTYGNVNEAKARQIVAQHVVNGQPIYEWAINVKEAK